MIGIILILVALIIGKISADDPSSDQLFMIWAPCMLVGACLVLTGLSRKFLGLVTLYDEPDGEEASISRIYPEP